MTLPGTIAPPPSRAPAALDAQGDGIEYARWSRRVAGDLLDGGIITGVSWLALGDPGSRTSVVLGMPSAFDADASWHRSGWVAATVLVVLALQAWTGRTPGKLVVGIAVVGDGDGRPIGLLRTLVRWALHVVDTILFIGYLRPLWHRERRTFADSIMHTVVVRRRARARGRWTVVLLRGGTLALCLLGLGLTVPWVSTGDPVARGEVVCAPILTPATVEGDDAVGAVSPVRLTGLEARTHERRLWVDTLVDVYRSYHASWTWTMAGTGGDVAVEDLAIELTATGADGRQETQRLGVAGLTTEVNQVEAQYLGGGTVTAGVDLGITRPADLGHVVDLTTSLLSDQRVVASCTVEDFALTPVRR